MTAGWCILRSWLACLWLAVACASAGAQVPVTASVPDAIAPGEPVTPSTSPSALADEVVQQLWLRYEASVAGIPAGEAEMVWQRGTGAVLPGGADRRQDGPFTYRVAGTARSKGLWESMQQWRAEYSIEGAADADRLSPGHFYSLQTTPRKRREIHIEDGVLRETKNHKVRDPRPAQTGLDLLSALFALPACHAQARVHTGRDGYDMTRKRAPIDTADDEARQCAYEVRDDEGGRYGMTLRYARLLGKDAPLIPVEIRLQGALTGRLALAEHRAEKPEK